MVTKHPTARRFPNCMTLYVGQTPISPPLRRVVQTDDEQLLTRIRRISARLPGGWPVGLERDLLKRGSCKLSLAPATIRSEIGARIGYLEGGSRSYLLARPAPELAARIVWDRLAANSLGPDELLQAAMVLGGEAHFRSGRAFTSTFATGERLEFLKPEQIDGRLASLLERLNRPRAGSHPFTHAVGIYFDMLLIHPLPDGNGRLARLLFQGALRQTIGLRAPILPLGPACARNRPALISGYLAWQFDRDAQPLADFIMSAVSSLATLYERSFAKTAP